MVKLLATKLANKDTASQQGTINETSLQQTIAKQVEVTMPSIIEATVNHMLQNKLLDKSIKKTVGTTVSTMTGDIEQHVEKNKKKAPPLAVLVPHLLIKDESLHEHMLEAKISQTMNNLKNHHLRILERSIRNDSSHKHSKANHFSSEKC
eukprot:5223506-Ditylum_brightwellii.AAC.1